MNISKTKSQLEEERKGKLIGYLIAPFILGWVFVWYNYVWIQLPIGYWQWVAIGSISAFLTPLWLRNPIFSIIFFGAALGQVLNWLGLVVLPFIKLTTQ